MNNLPIPHIHGNRHVVDGLLIGSLTGITQDEQEHMVALWGQSAPLIYNGSGIVIPVGMMAAILRDDANPQYEDLLAVLEWEEKQGAAYIVTKVVGELS